MPRTRHPGGWIVRPPKTLKSTRYRYRYKYRYRYMYKYRYKYRYRYRGKWARSPTHAVAQSAVADPPPHRGTACEADIRGASKSPFRLSV